MTQHSLLLSTPMVLATLRGDKTVTRRTPSCTNSLVDGRRISGKAWKALQFDWSTTRIINGVFVVDSLQTGKWHYVHPIYNQGDTIWFKETWRHGIIGGGYWYKADATAENNHPNEKGIWKSSMFMPRAACRLFATVSAPCVCERLHDITEEQAKREGVEPLGPFFEWKHYGNESSCCRTAKESFRTLWQSINGPDSYAANPPVYVIPFELIPEPEVLKEGVNTMGE